MAPQRGHQPHEAHAPRVSSAGAGRGPVVPVNGEPVVTQARIELQPGDIVRLELPGGGGYGAVAEATA